MFFFDIHYLIYLLPAILLGLYAQGKVKSTFAKYSRVANRRGLTGAQAARHILDSAGLQDVPVEHVPGRLSDHYDPRSRTLRLSDGVYNSPSVAAMGIAAHECGHAIQHDTGYVPLSFRNNFFPIANIGSSLALPLVFIGFLLGAGKTVLGGALFDLGILAYIMFVAFTLVTLPVEFNASRRAMAVLTERGIVTIDEGQHAKKVLDAAALTYVAAALSAVMTLLYLIGLRGDD
ncbi:MAG: zinc metallopeptidase [bacterium]